MPKSRTCHGVCLSLVLLTGGVLLGVHSFLGTKVPPVELGPASGPGQPMYPVYLDRRVGFINNLGELVIAPQFGRVRDQCPVYEARVMVRLLPEEVWGVVNSAGQWVVEPRYSRTLARFFEDTWIAEPLEMSLFSVKSLSGCQGILSSSGEWIVEPRYDALEPLFEGLAAASEQSTWGYIDATGAWRIGPRFLAVGRFREGLAAARVSAGWGYLDHEGRWAIEPKFDSAHSFSEGFAVVGQGGQYGLIDPNGRWLVEPVFDAVLPFEEGLSRVAMSGKAGYIDRHGQWTIETSPDMFWTSFTDGLAPTVGQDGAGNKRYGFIDRTGRLAIPAIYQRVFAFEEGLAAVQTNEGWGFINKEGEIAIDARFQNAESFHGELAMVDAVMPGKEIESCSYISKDGKFVWPTHEVGKEAVVAR